MYIFIAILVVVLLSFVVHRRRYVKFGMKVLGATFFLEASDDNTHSPNPVEFQSSQADSKRDVDAVLPPTQKLIAK